jgi:sec-independent protein translocase protein TatA
MTAFLASLSVLGVPPVLAWLGATEMWIILAVCMLLFGAKKLPGLARSMGSSIDQFRKGLNESKEEAGPNARLDEKNADKEK